MWRFIAFAALLAGCLGVAFYLKGESEKLPSEEVGLDGAEAGEPHKVSSPLDLGQTPRAPASAISPAEGMLKEPILVTGCLLSAIAEQPVGARADGKLVDNYVKLGETVEPGQTLGQMDETLARLAVNRARIKAESDAAINTALNKLIATREMFEKEKQLRAQNAGTPQDLLIKEYQMKEAQGELNKSRDEQEEARRFLAEKEYELGLLKLRSDIHGTVTKINKRPGSPVRAGEPLYEIVNLDQLWVEGLIPRESASHLRPGMRVRVEPERLEAPIRELRYHTAAITGLALSPDSRLLASTSEDGRVVVWDWQVGRPLWVGRDKNRLVEFLAVAFSPVVEEAAAGVRSYQLLVGGGDGTARLWTLRLNANGGLTDGGLKEFTAANGHTNRIHAVAFSPDGRYVVTGGADFQILLWNAGDQKLRYKVQARKGNVPAHRGFVTKLVITPDRHLVSVATDKTVKRWLLGTEAAQLVASYDGRTGDVGQLAISPDGTRALFDTADELRVLNLLDGSIEGIMYSRYGQFRNLALVGPHADVVLTTTAQGRLQLLTMPPRPEDDRFFRMGYQAGFRENSLLALTDLTCRLLPSSWTTRGLSAVLAGTQPKAAPLPRFQFVPAFPTLAATEMLPQLAVKIHPYSGLAAIPELWNLGSYELRHLKTADEAGVTTGVFAPQGGVFFTGGNDRIIRAWNLPPAMDQQDTVEAVLTYVGSQAEATTTPLVRIRAELDNAKDPARRLLPNTKVNLTIFPEAVK